MENEYRLNPFVFIAKSKDSDRYLLSSPFKLNKILTERQAVYLMSDNPKDHASLLQFFDLHEIGELKASQCLIQENLEMHTRHSRTKGYFFELGLLNAYEDISNKKVLILGAGGLGSHMAWGMCSLGIGELTIIDYDVVEETNLNRQLLYTSEDIGVQKIHALQDHLMKQNPSCLVQVFNDQITNKADLLNYITKDVDLVIRAMDTPDEISNWVYSICKEQEVAYVGGGTVGSRILLGPSYLPGSSQDSPLLLNNEIVSNEVNFTRVHGTGVSSGPAMYKLSSEILLEGVKILLNRGDLLKFRGKMVIEDLFEVPIKKSDKVLGPPQHSFVKFSGYLLFVAISMLISMYLSTSSMSVLIYEYIILSLVTYLFWAHEGEAVLFKNAMIGGSIVGIINVIGSVALGRFNFMWSENVLERISLIPSTIFTLIIMICLSAAFLCMITYFLQFVFKNNNHKLEA